MKRQTAWLIIGLALLYGIWPVGARTETIRYEIYYDSRSTDIYALKEDVLETFDNLCERVDDSSYASMLVAEQDAFYLDGVSEVSFGWDVLTIRVGDGKGTYLEGELIKQSCEIKPQVTSWFAKER